MYIYLIEAGEGEAFKVGVSESPERRVRDLQTASPMRLRLVWTLRQPDERHARFHERLLHAMLMQYRLHGEWFRLPPCVVERLCYAGVGAMLAEFADSLGRSTTLPDAGAKRLMAIDAAALDIVAGRHAPNGAIC